ncbi:hypothetical protein AB0912_02820 [Streptomyces sp. NPDC007084]|uniref:hypothetical protein n=1 Tax=Streptomyces sp. NPDC007084 TaxID=3154313 RepID=UPI0034538352
MRLRTSRPLVPAALTLGPAVALVLSTALAPAPARASEPRPACVASDVHDFPVRSRIHGGPRAYQPGGDSGTWYIDLTNTTSHTCGAIHPVVVLADTRRTLRPEQLRMEFYEGERAHPVTFERSDESENVAPFDDGFPGFTVAPGRTLTVKVRLSLTSAATAPNDVVATASVVQRHGGDGDWVGESGDYRFHVGDPGDPDTSRETGTDEGRTTDPGTATADADPGTGSPSPHPSTGTASADAQSPGTGTGTASPGASEGAGVGALASSAGTGAAAPDLDELARTGPGGAPNRPALAALAVALTALGAGLLVVARRLRTRRR